MPVHLDASRPGQECVRARTSGVDGASYATVAGATIKRCVARPVEKIEKIVMVDVGDRIAVASKGKPRSGAVTAVKGAMITVRWDRGGETSLIPGPGVLSVVTSSRRTPSAQTRPTTSGAKAAARKTSAASSRSGVARKAAPGKKPVAKKTAPGKKPVAMKTAPGKKPVAKKTAPGKKPVAKKTAPGKKPVAKKTAPGKKPVAKGTSSSRTTGKKTR
jgi:DNA-binding protein HU-beta